MLFETHLVNQTTQNAMGTVMTHRAHGIYAEDALISVCQEIERIEELLSRFLPGSDISRINASAGIKNEKVSPETFELLEKALEFSRSFPGCFDITIAPLIDLWRESRSTLQPPHESSIKRLLPLVDRRDVMLDAGKMSAGLRHAGQSIDLGGIGKGFAADSMRQVYQEFGITSAYSNLGGNVVTLGAKPDSSPWRVGIQHPRQEGQLVGCVSAVDQTVVTSGDYQRYFSDRRGKRQHHILAPATGYPAESGLVSVSIVAEQSLAADALSTILFVAGMDRGLEYLRSFPQTEAVFIDRDLRVYLTKGLRYRFQANSGIEAVILD